MNWESLASWIAIAITMALSILVPVFTQIANNSHQRKMQKEKIEYEKSQRKREVYEKFLLDVGGAVTAATSTTREHMNDAGASLYEMYIYAPSDWQCKLDKLASHISKYEWKEARLILQELSRLISLELQGEQNSK